MEVERGAEYFDYLARLSNTHRYRVFAGLKYLSAQTKLLGKIQEVGRNPLLGRFKGECKGWGSRANPAKRFVREKEEQRNGRDLPLAAG